MHEIGHFLGLGHPDNIPNNWFDHPIALPTPGQNSYQTFLASGGRMNSSYCRMAQLWDDVKPGVPPDSEIDLEIKTAKYPVVDSQMEAIAQFNPRTCLTDDDLEAILDFAFERYFNESGLFGTVEDALSGGEAWWREA